MKIVRKKTSVFLPIQSEDCEKKTTSVLLPIHSENCEKKNKQKQVCSFLYIVKIVRKKTNKNKCVPSYTK